MEDAAVSGDPPPPEQKMVWLLLGRPVPHSGRVGALQTHFALPAFVLWMNTSVSRGFCGIVILGNVAFISFQTGHVVQQTVWAYSWGSNYRFIWLDFGSAHFSELTQVRLFVSSPRESITWPAHLLPSFNLLLLFCWHGADSSTSPLAKALRRLWAYYEGNYHVHYPMYIRSLGFCSGSKLLTYYLNLARPCGSGRSAA